MNKLTILKTAPLVLVLILLSGCITPSGGGETPISGGQGVVITKFSTFITKITSGETFTMEIHVKNVGDAKAESVNATIFNLGPFKVTSSNPIRLGSLDPPRPEYNLPPGEAMDQWSLKAPDVEQPYTHVLKAKVEYDYNTYAYASIPAVTTERWRELNKRGGTLYISKYCSNAPIKVDFEGPVPIVVRGEDAKYVIVVENVGNGYVKDDKLTKLVVGYEVAGESCNCTIPSGTCGSDCSISPNELKLIGGDKRIYTFTIKNLDKKKIDGDENTIFLRVDVKYTYVTEAHAQVTIYPPL